MDTAKLKLLWDEYASLYFKYTPEIQRKLLEYVSSNAYGNVLDAGSGVGKSIPYLIRNKKVKSITSVELNSAMINIAIQNYNCYQNVKFEQKDILELNYSQSMFDTILLTNVAYSVNNIFPFLKQSFEFLKPKGQLIISNPNRSVDMNELEKIISFEWDSEDLEFQRYLEINKALVNKRLMPRTYDFQEIIGILDIVGFEKNHYEIENNFYEGQVTSVIAKKY